MPGEQQISAGFRIGHHHLAPHITGGWCAWDGEYPEDGPIVIGTLQACVDEVLNADTPAPMGAHSLVKRFRDLADTAERAGVENAAVVHRYCADELAAVLATTPEPPKHPMLTPEREEWLRKKPAHYHVHEVWATLEALRAELEQERGKHAACGASARGYSDGITPESWGWSDSVQAVIDLYATKERLRLQVEEMRKPAPGGVTDEMVAAADRRAEQALAGARPRLDTLRAILEAADTMRPPAVLPDAVNASLEQLKVLTRAPGVAEPKVWTRELAAEVWEHATSFGASVETAYHEGLALFGSLAPVPAPEQSAGPSALAAPTGFALGNQCVFFEDGEWRALDTEAGSGDEGYYAHGSLQHVVREALEAELSMRPSAAAPVAPEQPRAWTLEMATAFADRLMQCVPVDEVFDVGVATFGRLAPVASPEQPTAAVVLGEVPTREQIAMGLFFAAVLGYEDPATWEETDEAERAPHYATADHVLNLITTREAALRQEVERLNGDLDAAKRTVRCLDDDRVTHQADANTLRAERDQLKRELEEARSAFGFDDNEGAVNLPIAIKVQIDAKLANVERAEAAESRCVELDGQLKALREAIYRIDEQLLNATNEEAGLAMALGEPFTYQRGVHAGRSYAYSQTGPMFVELKKLAGPLTTAGHASHGDGGGLIRVPAQPQPAAQMVGANVVEDMSVHFPDTKRRDPGCQCHQEEGDSPCPVHGSEEESSPKLTAASVKAALKRGAAGGNELAQQMRNSALRVNTGFRMGGGMPLRTIEELVAAEPAMGPGGRVFNLHTGIRGTIVAWPEGMAPDPYRRAVVWDGADPSDVRLLGFDSISCFLDEKPVPAPEPSEQEAKLDLLRDTVIDFWQEVVSGTEPRAAAEMSLRRIWAPAVAEAEAQQEGGA